MTKKTQEDLLGEIDNNKNGYVGRAERRRNRDNENENDSFGSTNYVEDVPETKTTNAEIIKNSPWSVDAYNQEHPGANLTTPTGYGSSASVPNTQDASNAGPTAGTPMPSNGTPNASGEGQGGNGAPVVAVDKSPEEQGVKAEEQYSPQDTLDPDAIKAFVEKEKQKAAVPENNNIDDILKRIENTEKRREEDEKRRTRNEAIMSLGEGIGALSNLYFTTKGAPNAYNPKEGMTDYQQAVYDRIEKRRRENEESSLNNRIKALEMQRKADLDALTKQYKERELSERARYNDYLQGKGELAQAKQDLEVYKVMNGTWYQQQSIEARKKINELAERRLAHLISHDDFMEGIQAIKAGGYTTTETVNDPTKGEVTKTSVRTPNRGAKNNSSKQTNTRGGNGTPTMFQ